VTLKGGTNIWQQRDVAVRGAGNSCLKMSDRLEPTAVFLYVNSGLRVRKNTTRSSEVAALWEGG
jgi:hypothetical protein